MKWIQTMRVQHLTKGALVWRQPHREGWRARDIDGPISDKLYSTLYGAKAAVEHASRQPRP